MALDSCKCAYIGKGLVWLRNRTRNGQFISIGNAANLNINIETEELELADNTVTGGGNCAKVTRVDSVNISFDASNLCSENLAIAYFGGVTTLPQLEITDEFVQGIDARTDCVLVKSAFLPSQDSAWSVDSAQGLDPATVAVTAGGSGYSVGDAVVVSGAGSDAVVTVSAVDGSGAVTALSVDAVGQGFTTPTLDLTGEGDGAATATISAFPVANFVEGTDWVRSSSGIVALDTGSIGRNSLLLDYSRPEQCVMEALIGSGDEYELSFEGLNEANSGAPVVVEVYRIKFDPATDFSLIGDEFASLSISGEALADSTKNGQGQSRFFRHIKTDC